MANDQDQYVHFTIKLLKGSFALNALWQDALNYHMIDQPDKLIALRLTEYYELVAKGGGARPTPAGQAAPAAQATPAGHTPAPAGQAAPVAQTPTTGTLRNGATPPPPANTNGRVAPVQQPPRQHIERKGEIMVSSSSSAAEENAEEAADYWSAL